MNELWECPSCGMLEEHEVSDNETCLSCKEHVYSASSSGCEVGYLSDDDINGLL